MRGEDEGQPPAEARTESPAALATDVSEPLTRGGLARGHLVARRYLITGLIGRGGMGVVYRARHVRTGRELAIKVLTSDLARRPEVMQRFMFEARAAAGLNHPGIVEVVDMDHDGDLHFIAMEKLDGEELLARMEREKPLPIAFAARIGADIADAIGAAHAHAPPIIHRDLKPQNVILARKGPQRDIVKIVDFGIAKLLETESLEQSLTRSGEIYGTPLYMSPEQLRNSKEVDERTDVYSIGVIAYQALTGVTPFRAESFSALVMSINTEKPAPMRKLRPQIPEALEEVVARAIARSKEDRFPSAAALRDALLPFAHERGSAPALGATQRLASPAAPRRGRARVWLMVVGLAVAGAVVAAALAARRPPAAAVHPTTGPSNGGEAPRAASWSAPPATAPVASPPIEAPPAVTATPPAKSPPARARVHSEPASRARGEGRRRAGPDELPPLRPR